VLSSTILVVVLVWLSLHDQDKPTSKLRVSYLFEPKRSVYNFNLVDIIAKSIHSNILLFKLVS
jgi:hypothetical protein